MLLKKLLNYIKNFMMKLHLMKLNTIALLIRGPMILSQLEDLQNKEKMIRDFH